MKSRRFFTLLEVMVAIMLIAIASGGVIWKMQGAIRKKQFQSELERFRARLTVCQRLAVAMQADWTGTLKKNGKEWIFDIDCEEGARVRKWAPLTLHAAISLDGEKFDELQVDFFASGQVHPSGTLVFSQHEERVEWRLSEIFQRDEGKKQGPLCPAGG